MLVIDPKVGVAIGKILHSESNEQLEKFLEGASDDQDH
jgi:hypothetical protein